MEKDGKRNPPEKKSIVDVYCHFDYSEYVW